MSHDFNEQCLFFCSKACSKTSGPLSNVESDEVPLWVFAAGIRHAAGPRANTFHGFQQCSKDHAGV